MNWHAGQLRTAGPSPGIDVGADDGANICIVHPQDGGDPETRRVASQIAAAPELLESLKYSEQLLSQLLVSHPGHPSYRVAVSSARAAIAKAEGRQG